MARSPVMPDQSAEFATWFSAGIERVELLSPHDQRTCHRARSMDGKTFPIGKQPNLPLHGCDAEDCRCLYVAVIDD